LLLDPAQRALGSLGLIGVRRRCRTSRGIDAAPDVLDAIAGGKGELGAAERAANPLGAGFLVRDSLLPQGQLGFSRRLRGCALFEPLERARREPSLRIGHVDGIDQRRDALARRIEARDETVDALA